MAHSGAHSSNWPLCQLQGAAEARLGALIGAEPNERPIKMRAVLPRTSR